MVTEIQDKAREREEERECVCVRARARVCMQVKELQSKKKKILSKYDFCCHGKIIGLTDIILAVRIATSLDTREFFPAAVLIGRAPRLFSNEVFSS